MSEFQKLIAFVTVGIALVICGAIFGVANEWSPGNQDVIAAQYRAHLHEAMEVVAR